MCIQLTRSHEFAGEICPFEKYCLGGCPCQFYHCEKIEKTQRLVPLWNLEKGKIIEGSAISKRLTVPEGRLKVPFKKFPILFSNLGTEKKLISKDLINLRPIDNFSPSYVCFFLSKN